MQPDYVNRIVRLALDEDIGTGDVTTLATVPEDAIVSGTFIAKATGIISGLDVVARVFEMVDPDIWFDPQVDNGSPVLKGKAIARVEGNARSILSGERVALNFLQRLSGIATLTAEYVVAVEGTGARVIDTRKTTPGMRLLEKQAIRDGGGHNHRVGLSDGILIKDNHLAAIGGAEPIADAIAAARELAPHTLRVEVEITTLDELEQALAAGADTILLDNMSSDEMAEAVRRTNRRAVLEASGGITLANVREVAETGVDLISVGALTHSAPALDISLELDVSAGRDGEPDHPS
ncbi:MAG TPA: carboxylating nicotinate-nucleotide diphosphorylase [Thermomicrobiaceae bacterium]|nr:carboxylating nicotinate-nucleotide diphosphorylase [Thermomicrobiaceae bacterium]